MNQNRASLGIGVLTTWAVVFGGLTATAAGGGSFDPDDVTVLAGMTVTATASEQDVYEVPYMAHVLDRNDLHLYRSPRTLTNALMETPGVMVQKTSYGQASPYLRGFTGFRTLMMVDGVRLNNAVFREGPNQYWSTVDIHSVDHLDLVLGPSSVLYGSDAVGGTVNVLTRSATMPDEIDGTGSATSRSRGMEPHGEIFYRYSTAEDSQTLSGSVEMQLGDGLDLFAGLTGKDFGDLRGGEDTGSQPGTGYEEKGWHMKSVWRANDRIDVTMVYQELRQEDVPRTHATYLARSFEGTAVGTDIQRDLDQDRQLGYVQMDWRDPAGGISRINASLSWHRQAEEQDRIRSNRRREVSGFVDDQFGAVLTGESTLSWGRLNYGAEYYHDDVSSSGIDISPAGVVQVLPRGPVADDASYDMLGLYLQDQFHLGNRVEVTAGARYSWARAQAKEVDPIPTDAVVYGPIDEAFDAITFSLRGNWTVSNSWSLFGGASQGFRAPNLSDFTSYELARSGERETPAPDLTEEKFLSLELGTKARFDAMNTQVFVTLFHCVIEDQITRYPTGRIINGNEREVTKANTGDGYSRGIEFGISANLFPRVSVFGNFSVVDGEIDTYVGDVLTRVPASRLQPATALAGVRWRSANARLWAECTGQIADRQDKLSPGDIADTQRIPPGGTPGYTVLSVRGGWRIGEHLDLTAALENLLNEDYRIHGSGTNEPGTNLSVTARLRF